MFLLSQVGEIHDIILDGLILNYISIIFIQIYIYILYIHVISYLCIFTTLVPTLMKHHHNWYDIYIDIT